MDAHHKDNLRSLLEGLECENVDTLMESDNPLLFRVLGERIAKAAKFGAHLMPKPDWP
jgi:hypothetical protein